MAEIISMQDYLNRNRQRETIMSNKERIRALNDKLRTTGEGGRIVLTHGVVAQDDAICDVITKMCNQTEFTPDNDPYGEHDFGMVEHNGKKYFWKIDYYDPRFQCHSENAADPAVTNRVLTVMLAEEY